MDFDMTIQHLNRYSDNEIVRACIESMNNEVIMFSPGFTKNAAALTDLYELRLKSAMKLNNNRFSENEIKSWEIAINQLKQSNVKTLRLNSVDTGDRKYLLFWNNATLDMEAVFFLSSKNSIAQSETYNDHIINMGYSVSSIQYKKGIQNKVWSKT